MSFDITIYTIKKEYKLDEDLPSHEKLHYVYICKKKPDADSVCKEKFPKVIEELNKQEKLEEEEEEGNFDEEGDEEDIIDLDD